MRERKFLPRNALTSSPSQHLAYSCLWIPWLYKDPVCLHVLAEDRHEGGDKSFGVMLVVCENGFEIRW
jgi:hypothetical protein